MATWVDSLPYVSDGLRDAKFIIGVDEVGTGAWAGPLVVAGAVYPLLWSHPKAKDSKKFKDTKKRTAHQLRKQALDDDLLEAAVAWTVHELSSSYIDKVGIYKALIEATAGVVNMLTKSAAKDTIIVLDGTQRVPSAALPSGYPALCMASADRMVPAVSVASMIAKVHRDDCMIVLAERYPGYDFENNKGYGTKRHRAGIEEKGLCPMHRRSYHPISEYSVREIDTMDPCQPAPTEPPG